MVGEMRSWTNKQRVTLACSGKPLRRMGAVNEAWFDEARLELIET